MSDDYGLLAAAFPRHGPDRTGPPFCAWCGHDREAWMALCRKCWKSLMPEQRNSYLARSMTARARWILDNKPKKVNA